MSDYERSKEKKLHNSDGGDKPEESGNFLAWANRLMNKDFEGNYPVYLESLRKASEWAYILASS